MGIGESERHAVEVLAEFLQNCVRYAKGASVAVSVKRVKKWYEKRSLGNRLPGTVAYFLARILIALYRQGYIYKIGNNYVLYKDMELWRAAKEGFLRQFLLAVVAKSVATT